MTVVWEASAYDELAEIWLRATPEDRQGVTIAAAELDRRLRFNASFQGESRPHGRRVVYAPPLGVTFRVSEDDQMVYVLRVWYVRRRQR